MIKQYM